MATDNGGNAGREGQVRWNAGLIEPAVVKDTSYAKKNGN